MSKIDKEKYKQFDKQSLRSRVEYLPILSHLFEVGVVFHDTPMFYSDLWKQQLFRFDGTYPHPNGTMNLSYELLGSKNKLRDENGKISNEAIGSFFKTNESKFPQFYTSPRKREYISILGGYKIRLDMTKGLFTLLTEQLTNNNMGYLGNSEGWVHIKFIENDRIKSLL